jgi:hypothetical protein
MRAADPPERIRALIAAYRATHYDVTLPNLGVATLRVGAPLPARVHAWIGADPLAAFLTACNPRSETLGDAENARRLAALRAALRPLPCRVLDGVGHVPGEAWREPSLLVSGSALGDIDAFARAFGQNAILVIAAGRSPLLRIYRDDWRAALAGETDLVVA